MENRESGEERAMEKSGDYDGTVVCENACVRVS